jgi:hypothetical protein
LFHDLLFLPLTITRSIVAEYAIASVFAPQVAQ